MIWLIKCQSCPRLARLWKYFDPFLRRSDETDVHVENVSDLRDLSRNLWVSMRLVFKPAGKIYRQCCGDIENFHHLVPVALPHFVKSDEYQWSVFILISREMKREVERIKRKENMKTISLKTSCFVRKDVGILWNLPCWGLKYSAFFPLD